MIYYLASFSQATLSSQFPLWLHQLLRAKITIYLCGTPHSQFSFNSFRSSGGMRVCMYLPMVRACSTSCFEEERLSVEEGTDLSLKPQSFVLSLLLELASAHRVDRGWGVDFHSLFCQEHTERAETLEECLTNFSKSRAEVKDWPFVAIPIYTSSWEEHIQWQLLFLTHVLLDWEQLRGFSSNLWWSSTSQAACEHV